MTEGTTYLDAGVSIDAGNELVRRIRKIVSGSGRPSSIGGFSGLFPLPGKSNLYLSGCCDGVGTKLKVAFILNRHDTVGIDLVAMNVNDLICQGAKPLFFLDYFACGKLDVDTAEQVIRGIQKGCAQSSCVLLGGETAEMPGFYKEGEYDLAGFAVGFVEKKNLFQPKKIRDGDPVIGLPSTGPHSNGYSLIRKVFSEPELAQYGGELLAPTRIYVKTILALLAKHRGAVKGLAHITGGGWIDNPPRMLPAGFHMEFKEGSWPVPAIFERVRKKGGIEPREMFRTFNMGIGMMMVVGPENVAKVRKSLKESYVIGRVRKGAAETAFV